MITKKKTKHFRIVIILSFLLLVLTGCTRSNSQLDTKEPAYLRKSSFLLNTIVTITLYDKQEEDILEECFDLIQSYEMIYSRTNSKSELFEINKASKTGENLNFPVSEALAGLLKDGLYYSSLSKGSFDITVAPVTSLWDFTSLQPTIPSEEKIENALTYVNYQDVTVNNNTLTLEKAGINFDLGAIAKGYIADKVKEHLLSRGVKSAMINLGGNVLCVGHKPDGSPFRIGIQKPFADRNETIEIMELVDYSVVSSGIYERFFQVGDKIYHHILNPKTGYPFETDLISVTILSKKSVDGDGLSTTTFALGLDEGMKLINSLPDTYAVFITDDYEVHYSEGFLENIPLVEEK